MLILFRIAKENIMEKNELNNFIDKMKEAIYKAGEMALEYQGRVKNLKKEAEELPNDNDFVRQQSAICFGQRRILYSCRLN